MRNLKFCFCIGVLSVLSMPLLVFAQSKSEKRGIAFGHHTEADFDAVSSGISWWYNWYVEPESPVKDTYEGQHIDFVPMVWGAGSDTAKLRRYLKTHQGVKYILGFNEPNFRTQSNMTPAQAAANWPRIEKIADEFNLKIVGPAVNYCDQCVDIPGTTSDADPVAYLDAFFAACPDCRVDYIGVHNYMCYAGPLADYIARFGKYGKKIWLTEFACWDQATITLAMQKSLVIGAIDYLENDTSVFRYSWFTGDRNGNWPFIDIYGKQPGQLTELGQLYVNFNPIHNESEYFAIPARIEAESYSKMSGIQLEATQDFDGMANVGYFDGGDWLQYNVNVPETGEYHLYMRISSNTNTSVLIREDGETLATIPVTSTGGWQNWKNFSQKVNLTQGEHKLQVFSATGSLNINWIAFSEELNEAPTVVADEDTVVILPQNSVYLTCSASDANGDNLTYKWTRQSGATNAVISDPSAPATGITGLTKGTYTFRVTVSDGIETTYDQVKVTVNELVGTEELVNGKLKIYPNPAGSLLKIEILPTSEDTQVFLFSGDGRLFSIETIAAGDSKKVIDIDKLKSGIYMVRIENSNGFKQKLFVKQ